MNQFHVIYLLKMEKSLPSVSDGLPKISTACSSVAFSPPRSCTWAITIKMHPQFAEQRYDFHPGSSWILIYILDSDFPVMMPWFSWTKEMWDFKKQSAVGNLNLKSHPWKNVKGPLFTANGNSTSHSHDFVSSFSLTRHQNGPALFLSVTSSFHFHLVSSFASLLSVALSCMDVPPNSTTPRELPRKIPWRGHVVFW